mgnify:CR=1 FL=1
MNSLNNLFNLYSLLNGSGKMLAAEIPVACKIYPLIVVLTVVTVDPGNVRPISE